MRGPRLVPVLRGHLTFKNAEPLRDALRPCPLDQLLVETDAPYLTPCPHRGRPNAGYLVPLTARRMARSWASTSQTLCDTIDSTTERPLRTVVSLSRS